MFAMRRNVTAGTPGRPRGAAGQRLTALQIKEFLLQSTDYVSALDGKVLTSGRLNVAKALQAVQDR